MAAAAAATLAASSAPTSSGQSAAATAAMTGDCPRNSSTSSATLQSRSRGHRRPPIESSVSPTSSASALRPCCWRAFARGTSTTTTADVAGSTPNMTPSHASSVKSTAMFFRRCSTVTLHDPTPLRQSKKYVDLSRAGSMASKRWCTAPPRAAGLPGADAASGDAAASATMSAYSSADPSHELLRLTALLAESKSA